jgi:hypothetical protein
MAKGMPRSRVWALLVAGAAVALAAQSCTAPTATRARQAEQRLQRAIKQLAASGAPIKATQLAKPPVPDAENAALVYEKAFAAVRVTEDDKIFLRKAISGKLALGDPAIAMRVEGILTNNAKTLQLVHRAAKMPRCDFHLDWSKGAALTFPQFAPLRNCARLLGLKATMLAHRGRTDQALAVCGDGLRVAKAGDDPVLIGALVRYAIIAITCRSVEQVLRDSHPSASACRQLAGCVAHVDANAALMSALEGERAMGISIFEQVKASPDPIEAVFELSGQDGGKKSPSRAQRSGSFTRWWLASDELTYLELMDRTIKEAPLPYRKATKIHPSVDETLDRLPAMPPRMLTAILVPVYSRTQVVRDRAIATLGIIEVALLLKAYRAERGGYPQSLQELGGINGHALPADPFSGKPFVYRREGAGFLIYSWGSNLKDDGGKVGERVDEGDIVVRCGR